jgi:hypothetical protein
LTLRKKIENAISTGEITPHLFFRFSQTKTDNAKWPDVLFFWGGSKFGGILGGYKILEVLGVLKM